MLLYSGQLRNENHSLFIFFKQITYLYRIGPTVSAAGEISRNM